MHCVVQGQESEWLQCLQEKTWSLLTQLFCDMCGLKPDLWSLWPETISVHVALKLMVRTQFFGIQNG